MKIDMDIDKDNIKIMFGEFDYDDYGIMLSVVNEDAEITDQLIKTIQQEL